MAKINKIAVLTSGGDAPGMNAAIRAVVRSCVYYSLEVAGIYNGFQGLIDGDIHDFHVRSVNKILGAGGTMLKSSRCEEFRSPTGRRQAFENLQKHDIDALVVIGGNGSLTGAHLLHKEHGLPIIGIPATIDNDLFGTDMSIGFDTATNVVVEAIDKIRDTANSHDRLFFVEVMGRHSGFIALRSAIATGAVTAMMPEKNISVEELIAILRKGYRNKKSSSIVVVAEGNKNGGALEISRSIREKYADYEVKVSILGHLQRGGNPSCYDRVLASQLGVGAVEALLNGMSDVMVGEINHEISTTPIIDCIESNKELNATHLKIAQILSI